ncbi:MAG TPA: phosphatase PAP2 family protein [Chloroflexota bacterium]|nr:phosphatase PAP2 family protein [Chloroflexota bacterium]
MTLRDARPGRAIGEGARAPIEAHLPFLAAEGILLALLAVFSVAVRGHPAPLAGDVGMERAVQQSVLPHQWLAAPLEAVSTLHWPVPTAITLIVISALFLYLRRWLDTILTPLIAGASSLTRLELSKWVHRPRPSDHGIHIVQIITSSFSFPSGHVTYATSVYGLFLFLTYQVRHAFHPALLWAIRVVLVLLIVLMPVSRVLEGEHWPSDTVAGLMLGLFWVILFAHLYGWARNRWTRLLAADER